MTDIIAKVEQGELRGKLSKDYLGGDFYSFLGIPYAKPPLGSLRFKDPEPSSPWSGILDATKEASACYQFDIFQSKITGSEDCLYLNVYTPRLPPGDLKPVMVWIHGGGFVFGSGNADLYGPDFLVTGDVVLVTINYRLGVLGFLSLDDPKLNVPGNAGLKDQVLALRWVQRNIKSFGGDPGNVTIFGESAGGASVNYLMVSPLARGLFHKAIPQSGCVLCPWAFKCKKLADVVGGNLNLTAKNEEEILKALREIPVDQLLQAQLKFGDHVRADKLRPVAPVVEKYTTKNTFLSKEPLNILTEGSFNKVPLMIGYTDADGMLIDLIKFDHGPLITDFEEAIPHFLNIEKGTPLSLKIAERIKKFYYGDREPSLDDKDTMYKLHTDILILKNVFDAARLTCASSTSPVYFYRFSIDGPLNLFKAFGKITGKGASHCDELCYLFRGLMHPQQIDPMSIDGRCVAKMVRIWTNFAKYGNPNSPKGGDDLVNVEWKPFTEDAFNYLDIDYELTAGVYPEKERMEFWEEIYNLAKYK